MVAFSVFPSRLPMRKERCCRLGSKDSLGGIGKPFVQRNTSDKCDTFLFRERNRFVAGWRRKGVFIGECIIMLRLK